MSILTTLSGDPLTTLSGDVLTTDVPTSVLAYLAKIPPLHAGDANFIAELAMALQPFADAKTFLAALPSAFDLDTATGVQLDATGAWAGASRKVPVPVLNPWFSFDQDGLGWDQGYWQGPYEGSAISALDDETFRTLIRAKIAANSSKGTLSDVQSTLDAYFGSGVAYAVDETDYVSGSAGSAVTLRMSIIIAPALPSLVDLSILAQNIIPVQPAAVHLDWGITTFNGAPCFGFDLETDLISGWDVGAWGADPATVIETVILV